MKRPTAVILSLAALAGATTATTIAIADSPAPGVITSDPPGPCVPPDLKYDTLPDAKGGLAGSGCQLGTVRKVYPTRRGKRRRGSRRRCPRATKLIVTRQVPKANGPVPVGTKVNIVLTCGKQPR